MEQKVHHMTDANGLTALDADYYRPDPVTRVRVARVNSLNIYQKVIGTQTLPLVVSSAMDCGAMEYRVWVEKIEGIPYDEVCKMFAKGVNG